MNYMTIHSRMNQLIKIRDILNKIKMVFLAINKTVAWFERFEINVGFGKFVYVLRTKKGK